jgi:outer membrane lipoprotein SlyB
MNKPLLAAALLAFSMTGCAANKDVAVAAAPNEDCFVTGSNIRVKSVECRKMLMQRGVEVGDREAAEALKDFPERPKPVE